MQSSEQNLSKFYALDSRRGAEHARRRSSSAEKDNRAMDSAYLRGCAEIGQELVHFALTRVTHAADAARTLSYCRSPSELMTAWVEIARTAAKDFAEEMERLSEACIRMGAEMQNEFAASMEAAAPAATGRSSR